jgi:hypothetical protein
VSLLAFVGGLISQGKVSVSNAGNITAGLLWFAWGVAAATFCGVLTYVTNYCTSLSFYLTRRIFEPPYIERTRAVKIWAWAGLVFSVLAMLVGLFAVAIFVKGMLVVHKAILHLQ